MFLTKIYIDPVPAAAPVSEPQGSSSSDEFICVYI